MFFLFCVFIAFFTNELAFTGFHLHLFILTRFFTHYSLFFVSIGIVTGPSFTWFITMCSPKQPVGTSFSSRSDNFCTKKLKSVAAFSGEAALMYDGLLPFFVLACKVN